MTLYVEETGTRGAPSIIFVHGIGASGWMWWQQTAALKDFHCLNIDLPGHGKSLDTAWVSLADATHQVAEIIQSRATNGKAHVVGLSLGGHIALDLLEYHADLLHSAVISGVTAAPMPNRMWLKPQVALMSLFKRRWLVERQAKALNLPPHAQAAFTENFMAMSMDTYERIYAEVAEYQIPDVFRQINTPTLITAGGSETGIILQAVDVIADMMPNAQGCLAPGHGHGWNVEAPELFNAMVRAWVTNAPLPAGLQLTHGSRNQRVQSVR